MLTAFMIGSTWVFLSLEQIVGVMGMRRHLLYDFEGNMIQKIEHPESIGGAGFMTISGKSQNSTTLNGKRVHPFQVSPDQRNLPRRAGILHFISGA